MVKINRKVAFEAAAVLLLIVLAFVLCLMVAAGGPPKVPQGSDYAGKAGLVLVILNKTDVSIQDHSAATYSVRVLYSNDSAIKEGADYYLGIEEVMVGYLGTAEVVPKDLVDGSIIGIDYYDFAVNDTQWPATTSLYDFDGRTIMVYAGADPKDKTAWDNAWKQKINIIGRSG